MRWGGRGHSFTSSFIIPQGFQKHLLCTRMLAGEETNRPRDRRGHSLPAVYLCTSVPNIVLNAESTEGRKSDFPNVFIEFISCA